MTTITTRAGKGSALTHAEVDANFNDLNSAKLELGQAQSSGTANGVLYLNGSKVVSSGSALTFDGTILSADTVNNTEVYIGGSQGTPILTMFGTASATPVIGYRGTGGIRFGSVTGSGAAGLSEQMRLTSTGLGIGTSSPSAKLEVSKGSEGEYLRIGGDNATNARGLRFTSSTNNSSVGALHTINAASASGAIALATNSIERMRLDASGNLGIGTSSISNKLTVQVTDASAWAPDSTNAAQLIFNNGVLNNATALTHYQVIYGNATTGGVKVGAVASGSYSADFVVANRNGGTFQENLRLNASGNLGIGVTPSGWGSAYKVIDLNTRGLGLAGGQDSASISVNAYFDGTGWKYKGTTSAIKVSRYDQYDGSHQWHTAAAGTAGAAISFTQAMTLDASGNLLVGTTSTPLTIATGSAVSGFAYASGAWLAIAASSDKSLILNRLTTDGSIAEFRRSGTAVGSISVTTTATAYNTSSDYRLKNVTGPITTSGQYIDALKPVEGTWKADGSTFVGLIAHEVQEVSSTQVATGVKDGEEMQGMDYSAAEIIANLIAEVQSLRKRVAQLEAK